MNATAKYLEISQVAKAFPGEHGLQVVVEDFNLSMRRGEFVSIIGHSGCGKSTVLSMVAGLTSTTAGAMVLAGKEITEPGPDRGVVFQSPNLFPWMTALENVRLGVEQVLVRKTQAEQSEVAKHYLELVGLGDSLHKKPPALSQGMRQRVGLARAFALTPNMLLLDEPFGMLDSLTRMELQDVLIELWAKDKKTALMVTHDVDEALFLSDRIVMMTQGPRAHVGEILSVPFARPRTRKAVLSDPNYYPLRERIIGFLESQEVRPKDTTPDPEPGPILLPLPQAEA
ncbi:MAG TPA: ABC transporter ATP-binding protein [Polyangiales bacterium]|nr:ABC transporter ATP-binding protein [Polyangiales bacterium]